MDKLPPEGQVQENKRYAKFMDEYGIFGLIPPFKSVTIRLAKRRYVILENVEFERDETDPSGDSDAVTFTTTSFLYTLSCGLELIDKIHVQIRCNKTSEGLKITFTPIINQSDTYGKNVRNAFKPDKHGVNMECMAYLSAMENYLEKVDSHSFPNDFTDFAGEKKPDNNYHYKWFEYLSTVVCSLNMLLMEKRPKTGYRIGKETKASIGGGKVKQTS